MPLSQMTATAGTTPANTKLCRPSNKEGTAVVVAAGEDVEAAEAVAAEMVEAAEETAPTKAVDKDTLTTLTLLSWLKCPHRSVTRQFNDNNKRPTQCNKMTTSPPLDPQLLLMLVPAK